TRDLLRYFSFLAFSLSPPPFLASSAGAASSFGLRSVRTSGSAVTAAVAAGATTSSAIGAATVTTAWPGSFKIRTPGGTCRAATVRTSPIINAVMSASIRSRIDRDSFWLGAAIEHGRDDAVAAQALGQLLAGALTARNRQFLRLHVRSFRRTGSRPIPRRECVGWPHRAAEPP